MKKRVYRKPSPTHFGRLAAEYRKLKALRSRKAAAAFWGIPTVTWETWETGLRTPQLNDQTLPVVLAILRECLGSPPPPQGSEMDWARQMLTGKGDWSGSGSTSGTSSTSTGDFPEKKATRATSREATGQE